MKAECKLLRYLGCHFLSSSTSPLHTSLSISRGAGILCISQTHFEQLQCAKNCLVHYLNTHAFLETGGKTAAPDQCRGADEGADGAVLVRAQSLSPVQLFVTSWTLSLQAPLSQARILKCVAISYVQMVNPRHLRRRVCNQIPVQRERNFMKLSLSLVFFKYLFIYFWLCWVFIAASRLSLVVVSAAYSIL